MFNIFKKKNKLAKYKLVTKDEFILEYTATFKCSKLHAIKVFNDISKGYNFVFEIDKYHFFSVEYVNKLLER